MSKDDDVHDVVGASEIYAHQSQNALRNISVFRVILLKRVITYMALEIGDAWPFVKKIDRSEYGSVLVLQTFVLTDAPRHLNHEISANPS